MSLTIAQALELLKTPGTRYSGADWKYGWPHKWYLNNDKVYNYDLGLLSDEELSAWSAMTEKFFGVGFTRDEKGIKWSCPHRSGLYGYQRAGVVGPDGEPVRSDEWSVDFSKEKI